MSENISTDTLRGCDSVNDITGWLEKRFPIQNVSLKKLKRYDHLPEAEDQHGWRGTISFTAHGIGTALWLVRTEITDVSKIRLDPYAKIEGDGLGGRVVTTKCTFLAEDFPGLWLMQRIRGGSR
jgi:hypothetical protein